MKLFAKRTTTSLLHTSLLFVFVIAAQASVFAQREMPISTVQGKTNLSPYERQIVRISGIVTARTRNGFFVQTPDARTDKDPMTSEGIYVFTRTDPPAEAVPGNMVLVAGRVEEFRPQADNYGLTITNLVFTPGRDIFSVLSKGNALPKPVVITAEDMRPNTFDQLEKYEGMRVIVEEMTTVAPSGGRVDPRTETVTPDGVFFGVLKGTPRPYREPGMDVRMFFGSVDRDKWKKEIPRLQIFDSNPELIRVDTDEQVGGNAVNIPAKINLKNIVGVLHYAWSRYTIFTDPDAGVKVESSISPLPLPPPGERQFSVAGINIESFFDEEDDPDVREDVATPEAFQKRLTKISRAVREYLQLPDIIGIVEAENIKTLERLAEKINADARAAGIADPKYTAHLFEGNDPRGIDNGYLVKSSRVRVISVKQFGKDERYRNLSTRNEDLLNDRTPIVLEAEIPVPAAAQSLRLTVVNNHLRSLRQVDDPKEGPNVRLKRKLQAEYLARWINERQKADPNERILVIGDLNAFQFSDGLVDVVGTIKGTPAAKDSVLVPTDDLVERDLINLVDMINVAERYSYIFDGSAQTLDHFLVNEPLRRHIAGFGFLRVNADFPQSYRADGGRVERFSDHDPAVGFFSLDPAQ